MQKTPLEKLSTQDSQSLDIKAENIAKLKALFPEILSEKGIDFDVLKQLLGEELEEAEERYSFTWNGKARARRLAQTPSTGTLRPCKEESKDWDTTQNLFIEGDNLEVLKLLQKSYHQKVKMIYIDPPYNTGKDFIYPDNFHDNIRNYLELTGQTDESGKRISANAETSGRFHTSWLNMMYPRLKLARNLLRDDGAVFISIDDAEVTNLRKLCDEIFGEENFVADIVVVTNMKGRNDKKYVASCHEHVIIYSKANFLSYGLPLSEEQRAAFKYEDNQGNRYALRDLRKRGGPDKRSDRPKMFFPIYWDTHREICTLERQSPEDIEIIPLRGDGSEGRWRWGKERVATFLSWLHPKHTDRNNKWGIEHRIYLDPNIDCGADDIDSLDDEEDENLERTVKPKSIWLGSEFSSDSGKRSLKDLLPGDVFDFPKSVDFVRQCVQIGVGKNEIVLDFFAGSGTTAQATIKQNIFDGLNRQYILVQLPEPLDFDNKDQKAAANYCAELGKVATIAELTKERIRRAGSKVLDENADNAEIRNLDVGFKVFKLDSSNIKPWDADFDTLSDDLLSADEVIKPDRGADDVLFEILLKYGLDLSLPVITHTLAGKTVFEVGAGALLVCLDREITEAVAEAIGKLKAQLAPAVCRVVFRDAGFADDAAKVNAVQVLKQFGIDDVKSL